GIAGLADAAETTRHCFLFNALLDILCTASLGLSLSKPVWNKLQSELFPTARTRALQAPPTSSHICDRQVIRLPMWGRQSCRQARLLAGLSGPSGDARNPGMFS